VNRVHAGLVDQDTAVALGQYLQAVQIAAPATTKTAAATIPTPVDSLLGGGATFCSDMVGPRDPNVWWHYAQVADRQVRGFGASDAYKSLPCATWPDRDQDTYRGPCNHGTAPVLLLSNRFGDPETPYAGAKRAEHLLGNAHLLALDAYGHGSLGKSACIDQAVDRYFGAGTLPWPGAVCRPDHRPFD
jgi:TAP-like protein